MARGLDAVPAPEARALRDRAGRVRGARHHRRRRIDRAAVRRADPAARHRRAGIHPRHRRHLQARHQVRRLARAQRFVLPSVRRHRQADRQSGFLPVLAQGARRGQHLRAAGFLAVQCHGRAGALLPPGQGAQHADRRGQLRAARRCAAGHQVPAQVRRGARLRAPKARWSKSRSATTASSRA